MATAPECIGRFEFSGIFAANPERMGRALRERAPGSWPASPIGGGGASPHVTQTHLANFLIAQTGFVPSGASNALAVLHDLPRFDYDRHHIPHVSREPVPPPPGKTLREFLEAAIDAAADPVRRDALTHWTLIMCAVDPPWATLDWRLGDDMYRAEFRRIGGLREPRGEHVEAIVRVPRPALLICGELWADSAARLATKDENAAALPGVTAPSTAPTARQRQVPSSSDASVRVRAPATTGVPPHARRRRNSLTSTVGGAA
jgi:hypothetical protein